MSACNAGFCGDVTASRAGRYWLGYVYVEGAIYHQTTISPTEAAAMAKARRWLDDFLIERSWEAATDRARSRYD